MDTPASHEEGRLGGVGADGSVHTCQRVATNCWLIGPTSIPVSVNVAGPISYLSASGLRTDRYFAHWS